MQDKPEGSHEQAQAAPSPPPPAPIPPANSPPVPPIATQGAATPNGDEASRNSPPEDKLTKNDKVMIALTIAIALGTIVSAGAIIMQWREMVGGGKQTDKLIEAANINAGAAAKFATAAQGINTGIGDAVTKLNLQAGATRGIAASTQNQEAILKEFLDAEIDKDQASVTVRNPRIIRDPRGIPVLEVDFFNAGANSATQVFYTYKRRSNMGAGYVNNREMTAGELKMIGTEYGPKIGWSQTQDISGNGSVPVDFTIQAATNISFTDVAQLIKGRIEYDTIFNKPRWKNFCLLVVVKPSTTRGEDWNYTPRFCVVGQEGDKA